MAFVSNLLGHLCAIIDCNRIGVVESPFSRSFTLGYTIWLAGRDRCALTTLAHETFHVYQWRVYGASDYLRRGVNDRVQELTGPTGPYDNGVSDPNSLEGAAQHVGDRYRGGIAGC